MEEENQEENGGEQWEKNEVGYDDAGDGEEEENTDGASLSNVEFELMEDGDLSAPCVTAGIQRQQVQLLCNEDNKGLPTAEESENKKLASRSRRPTLALVSV